MKKKLASKINLQDKISYYDYLINKKINFEFKFKFVSEIDIIKIIRELGSKSTFGVDGISSIFLKRYSHVLVKPLTVIINQSLQSGIFPDNLKIAKVLPIYKGNDLDKNSVSSYRPISVLPAISKVFEKTVYNQLLSYFVDHNLFYCSQYGFRPKHSTELAVLELTDLLFNH